MKKRKKVFFRQLNYLFNKAYKRSIRQLILVTTFILIGATAKFGMNYDVVAETNHVINEDDILSTSPDISILTERDNISIAEPMVTNDKINKYRERINLINLQILELLSSRGELAKKIGEEKRKLGLKVYDPKREEEIISQLLDQNRGPFDDEAIKDIFEEIFKASRDLQKK